MKAMSEAKRKATALRFFEQQSDFIQSLAARWQEEAGYEDIADYETAIQKAAKKYGIAILKMSTRPFGFRYTLAGCTYEVKVGRHYSYKRVA